MLAGILVSLILAAGWAPQWADAYFIFRIGVVVGGDGCGTAGGDVLAGVNYFAHMASDKQDSLAIVDASGTEFRVGYAVSSVASNCTEDALVAGVQALVGDGVQFLLGGSGERFAEAQSLAANELQRLLYHAALTRDGVYASNTRYVYGITTPASQYALPVLKAMVLSGILRVGLAWPRDDALLHEVGDAVLEYLPTLRQLHPSAVVLPYNFTSADSAAPGFAEALLRNLTSTGTEALIACVRPGAMASLVAALTTSRLRLRSTFLYDGTHMTNLTDQYEQDMLYKLTAAQWHPRIQYADEFFGSAAAYAAGLQAFVGRPATEDTAGASAAALTLGLSLRLAFRHCNISADVAASGDTARLLLDPRALSCGPEATGDLFPELLGGAGAAGPGGNVTGVVLSPAGAIGAPPPGATGNGTQPPRPAFAVTGYRLLMAQLDKNNFATFYGPVEFNRRRRNAVKPSATTQVMEGGTKAVVLPVEVANARLIMPAPTGGGGGKSKQSLPGGAIAGIVVGVLVLAVPLLAIYSVWRQQSRRNRNLFGQVRPPGLGADTTLLITDIEGSTTLWEALPSAVMEQAMEAHDSIIRALAAEHDGYESANEGDSFILAFHHSMEAVLFAVKAQQRLLLATWPEALMRHERAEPVWMTIIQDSTRLAAACGTSSFCGELLNVAHSKAITAQTMGTGRSQSLGKSFLYAARSFRRRIGSVNGNVGGIGSPSDATRSGSLVARIGSAIAGVGASGNAGPLGLPAATGTTNDPGAVLPSGSSFAAGPYMLPSNVSPSNNASQWGVPQWLALRNMEASNSGNLASIGLGSNTSHHSLSANTGGLAMPTGGLAVPAGGLGAPPAGGSTQPSSTYLQLLAQRTQQQGGSQHQPSPLSNMSQRALGSSGAQQRGSPEPRGQSMEMARAPSGPLGLVLRLGSPTAAAAPEGVGATATSPRQPAVDPSAAVPAAFARDAGAPGLALRTGSTAGMRPPGSTTGSVLPPPPLSTLHLGSGPPVAADGSGSPFATALDPPAAGPTPSPTSPFAGPATLPYPQSSALHALPENAPGTMLSKSNSTDGRATKRALSGLLLGLGIGPGAGGPAGGSFRSTALTGTHPRPSSLPLPSPQPPGGLALPFGDASSAAVRVGDRLESASQPIPPLPLRTPPGLTQATLSTTDLANIMGLVSGPHLPPGADATQGERASMIHSDVANAYAAPPMVPVGTPQAGRVPPIGPRTSSPISAPGPSLLLRAGTSARAVMDAGAEGSGAGGVSGAQVRAEDGALLPLTMRNSQIDMSTIYSGNSSKTNHIARLRALGLTGDELAAAGAHPEADERSGALSSSSTLGLLISSMFRRARPEDRLRILSHRGLRVRMGMHTGLTDPHSISVNKASGRTQYAGSFTTVTKYTSDAANGGQICLTEETYRQLPARSLLRRAWVLHMGQHHLGDYYTAVDEDDCEFQLYQVVGYDLAVRLSMLPQLRTTACLITGVLGAPVGGLAIAFMYVHALQALMAWNSEVAMEAVELFHRIAAHRSKDHDGYISESQEGLVLASFRDPAQALVWALTTQQALLNAPWDPELLEHELCEEVVVVVPANMAGGASTAVSPAPAPAMASTGQPPSPLPRSLQPPAALASAPLPTLPSFSSPPEPAIAAAAGPPDASPPAASTTITGIGAAVAAMYGMYDDDDEELPPGMVRRVLMRGLRMRVGIDVGRLTESISPVSSTVVYRGRAMNRAARIGMLAGAGQILCSAAAWGAARTSRDVVDVVSRVTANSLGKHALRGVAEPLEVFHCKLQAPQAALMQQQLREQELMAAQQAATAAAAAAAAQLGSAGGSGGGTRPSVSGMSSRLSRATNSQRLIRARLQSGRQSSQTGMVQVGAAGVGTSSLLGGAPPGPLSPLATGSTARSCDSFPSSAMLGPPGGPSAIVLGQANSTRTIQPPSGPYGTATAGARGPQAASISARLAPIAASPRFSLTDASPPVWEQAAQPGSTVAGVSDHPAPRTSGFALRPHDSSSAGQATSLPGPGFLVLTHSDPVTAVIGSSTLGDDSALPPAGNHLATFGSIVGPAPQLRPMGRTSDASSSPMSERRRLRRASASLAHAHSSTVWEDVGDDEQEDADSGQRQEQQQQDGNLQEEQQQHLQQQQRVEENGHQRRTAGGAGRQSLPARLEVGSPPLLWGSEQQEQQQDRASGLTSLIPGGGGSSAAAHYTALGSVEHLGALHGLVALGGNSSSTAEFLREVDMAPSTTTHSQPQLAAHAPHSREGMEAGGGLLHQRQSAGRVRRLGGPGIGMEGVGLLPLPGLGSEGTAAVGSSAASAAGRGTRGSSSGTLPHRNGGGGGVLGFLTAARTSASGMRAMFRTTRRGSGGGGGGGPASPPGGPHRMHRSDTADAATGSNTCPMPTPLLVETPVRPGSQPVSPAGMLAAADCADAVPTDRRSIRASGRGIVSGSGGVASGGVRAMQGSLGAAPASGGVTQSNDGRLAAPWPLRDRDHAPRARRRSVMHTRAAVTLDPVAGGGGAGGHRALLGTSSGNGRAVGRLAALRDSESWRQLNVPPHEVVSVGGQQQQLAVTASPTGGPATPFTARTVRLTPGGSNPNTHNSGGSGRGIPLSHALRSALAGVLGGGNNAGGGGNGAGDGGSRRRSMDDGQTAAAVAATAAARASHPNSAMYVDIFNTNIDVNEDEEEEMDEQTTTGDIGRHLYRAQEADEQHRTVYGTNWAAGTEAGEVASGGRSGRGSVVGPTGGRGSQGQVVDMEVEVVVPTFDEDEGDRATRHTERRR